MGFLRRPRLDSGTTETFQPRLWLVIGGLALLAIYIVAFIARNNKRVTVDFVLFSTETSVIWLILLCVAIGVVGGLLVSQLERRRRRRKSG